MLFHLKTILNVLSGISNDHIIEPKDSSINQSADNMSIILNQQEKTINNYEIVEYKYLDLKLWLCLKV